MIDNDFSGLNNFFWFVGVVEDRADPHYIGRVRVRCFGHHTGDKSKLPTEDLPWSQVMLPVTSAGISGIGQTPLGLVEGSHVFGFFRDGKNRQEPVIMGSLPGYPSEYGDPTKGFYSPIKATDDPYAPHIGKEKDPRYLTEDNSNHPRWKDSPDTNQMATKLIQGNRSLSASATTTLEQHPLVTVTKGNYGTLGPFEIQGTDLWSKAATVVSEGGGGGFLGNIGGIADFATGLVSQISGGILSTSGVIGGLTEKITGAVSGVASELGKWELPTVIATNDLGKAFTLNDVVSNPSRFVEGTIFNSEGVQGEFIKDVKTGTTSLIDSTGKNLGFDKLSTKRIVDGVEITEVDYTKKAVFGTGVKFIDNAQDDVYEEYFADASKTAGKVIEKVKDKATGAVINYVEDEFSDATSLIGKVLGSTPLSTNLPDIDTSRKTVYPRNHVYESESGHIMEYDDTPDATRVCQMHNSGTGYEIIDEGTKTEIIVAKDHKRVKGNSYEGIHANSDITDTIGGVEVPCAGHKNLKTDGHYKIFVNASGQKNNHYDLIVGPNANINIQVEKGDINLNAVDGNVNLRSGQNLDIVTGGTLSWKCEGKFILNAEDDVTIQGKNIYLN